jgi:hypothetical protein
MKNLTVNINDINFLQEKQSSASTNENLYNFSQKKISKNLTSKYSLTLFNLLLFTKNFVFQVCLLF